MDATLVLLLGLQALAGHGPKPQEKVSVPDWAIVLITLTLVTAIVSLLYCIKKACQFRKEMSVGCGCGSVTPYGCHHEATSQRYLVK
uniref:Mucin like 3 n=1 Tax=Rousettus aegyptiacus TaxID=9407 RepID=A0A7J8KD14_ROUAE|nr:mucin like 3 [Rousettus aegyptiacus]